MNKNISIAVLLICSIAIVISYLIHFLKSGLPAIAVSISYWLVAYSTSFMVIAFMIIGSAKKDRIGSLKWPFTIIAVILLVGFSIMLSLPTTETVRYLFGFPFPTAVMIYFVWLFPLFVIPLAYALTFGSLALDEDELEKVDAIKLSKLEPN